MQPQVKKLDFTGQNIYVGMDTHKNSWKVTVINDDLELKTFVQDPEPDILYNFLHRSYPGASFHCVYEASFCGYWIHYRLKELGLNSIVVNPADIPSTNKDRVQKEDKRDSRKLAKCLRNGYLTPIYIPNKKTLQDRSLVRTRFTLVKELKRFKHRIKSFLFFYGINIPGDYKETSSHWSKRFIKWLDTISLDEETATASLMILVQQVKNLRIALLDVTRKIRKLSKTEEYLSKVNLLRSIPGIGLITAMLIITELEDVCRFKSLDQLCSYIGFVPSTNSTGDKEIIGEITPRSHKALRTAIVESTWVAVKTDPALLMKFTTLCKRMEPNRAIIRIAKKLLNRIRYVIKNEHEYVKSVIQ